MNPEQYYCEAPELPKNPAEIGALSGTPREYRARTVSENWGLFAAPAQSSHFMYVLVIVCYSKACGIL